MYKNYFEYKILGNEVFIISNETDSGRNTVAVLPNQYYYLGDETPNIFSAIFAWQEANKRDLTHKELAQVMTDNGFVKAN